MTIIHQQIQDIREKGTETIGVQIATFHKIVMQPQQGIPQLYHDQINVTGQHLWGIKNNPVW